MTKEICGYMCKIAFELELGEDIMGTSVYPTKEDLIEFHKCAQECGIVKVKISRVQE